MPSGIPIQQLAHHYFSPRRLWHAARIECHSYAQVLRFGIPTQIIWYQGGLGDDLLCTTVVHEIRRINPKARVWILSDNRELFEANPEIGGVLNPALEWHVWHSLTLRSRRLHLAYTAAKVSGVDRKEDISPDAHVLEIMCRKAGVHGKIRLRPYIFLTDVETKWYEPKKRRIVIQAIGPNSGTAQLNKLWKAERFQLLVDSLIARYGRSIEIVQVGGTRDLPLRGVTDLRGRTSARQTAALLRHAQCFVGTEGFLMHLARSVDCRSAIIFGGRLHSWQTGYPCNENLDTHIDCAPCWKWNDCDYERRCMDIISVEAVANAVDRVIDRFRLPLEEQVVTI